VSSSGLGIKEVSHEETVVAVCRRWWRGGHCSTASAEQRQRLASLLAAPMGGMMEHMPDN